MAVLALSFVMAGPASALMFVSSCEGLPTCSAHEETTELLNAGYQGARGAVSEARDEAHSNSRERLDSTSEEVATLREQTRATDLETPSPEAPVLETPAVPELPGADVPDLPHLPDLGVPSADPAAHVGRAHAALTLGGQAGSAPTSNELQGARERALTRAEAFVTRVAVPRSDGDASHAGLSQTYATAEFPPLPAILGLVAGLLVLALPLLHRLLPNEALDHRLRQRLYELAQRDEGVTASEAARALAVSATTAGYHLRRLQASGMLAAENVGKRLCFHVPGRPPSARRARRLLRDPSARRLLGALREGPAGSLRELAARSGVSLATAHACVGRLASEGLVEVQPRPDAARSYAATEHGLALAAPAEGPGDALAPPASAAAAF
ncbi:MAG TPA: winged helix-turn-helix transcriptional regulator [Candidatus Thermoplasmatota archaeon]|nr:winged helix-turn-helix transcriptional regulator [Candidatus Thermoplasmatota archaeon]